MSRQQPAAAQLELGVTPGRCALPELNGEMWLARRLGDHGVADVFAGVTDPAERRRRIRELIVSRGLETIICGHRDRKPVRYAEAFERLYGEKLTSNPKGK